MKNKAKDFYEIRDMQHKLSKAIRTYPANQIEIDKLINNIGGKAKQFVDKYGID